MMKLKLKDKKGNVLNVVSKATYFSLLSTGNYTKVEENKENKPSTSDTNNKTDNKSENK